MTTNGQLLDRCRVIIENAGVRCALWTAHEGRCEPPVNGCDATVMLSHSYRDKGSQCWRGSNGHTRHSAPAPTSIIKPATSVWTWTDKKETAMPRAQTKFQRLGTNGKWYPVFEGACSGPDLGAIAMLDRPFTDHVNEVEVKYGSDPVQRYRRNPDYGELVVVEVTIFSAKTAEEVAEDVRTRVSPIRGFRGVEV